MSERVRRPVWLRREGDYVVVLVEEKKGEFREVIREYDGDPSAHAPFSHIWEDQQ